jgi:hypothetical protein
MMNAGKEEEERNKGWEAKATAGREDERRKLGFMRDRLVSRGEACQEEAGSDGVTPARSEVIDSCEEQEDGTRKSVTEREEQARDDRVEKVKKECGTMRRHTPRKQRGSAWSGRKNNKRKNENKDRPRA